MEPLSAIATSALNEITHDRFAELPDKAITILLIDFQYSWLRRLQISYNFELLNIARRLFNVKEKVIFNATNCKSVEEIRKAFSAYIEKGHKDDDRVLAYLAFDGKKINADWYAMKDYLKAAREKTATPATPAKSGASKRRGRPIKNSNLKLQD